MIFLRMYANGNAKSESFLSIFLLSRNNSRKYRPTAAVGKKGFFISFFIFFLTAAGGAICVSLFLQINCQHSNQNQLVRR